MHRLVAALDFGPTTPAVVAVTMRLAQAFGAQVRLVHVAPGDPAIASSKLWPQEVRDEFARELSSEHEQLLRLADDYRRQGHDVKGLLLRGEVDKELLAEAARFEADLLVVGAPRRATLLDAVTPGVVRSLLKEARCQLLVVPAPDAPPEDS